MDASNKPTPPNRMLTVTAYLQIIIGALAICFCAGLYLRFHRSTQMSELPATPEDYRQLLEMHNLTVFQFIPVLASVLILAGIAVLKYSRNR